MTTTHRRAGVLGVGLTTLATLATLALGACSAPTPYGAPQVAVRAGTGSNPASPTTTPVTPATATATATGGAPVQRVAVPAGAARTAPAATSVDPDALPWGEVGPGWSAVAYTTHPSTGTGTDDPHPVGPLTVALVSPTGRRWTVGSSAQLLDLRDVSPDGSHVLAVRWSGASSEAVELDTRRHTWRDVAPADNGLSLLRYTTPSAQQIWLGRFDGPTTQHVERVDRSGQVTLQVDGVDDLLPTGDGLRFVTWSPSSVAVHDNATGAVVRTVADPSGYHGCVPTSAWQGSVVAGFCWSDAAPSLSDVLLLDSATGRWSALTHASADDRQAPMGYDGALPTPGGPLVFGTVGCGAGPVGLLGPDGRIGHWLSWTGAAQSPSVLGVAGTTVYAQYAECASPIQVVASQVLGTGRTTVLVRAPWLSAVTVGERP